MFPLLLVWVTVIFLPAWKSIDLPSLISCVVSPAWVPTVVDSAEDVTWKELISPPVGKLDKSITAFVLATALPLPSLNVNSTCLVVALYLYAWVAAPGLVLPDAAPPFASVEPDFTAVGAIWSSLSFNALAVLWRSDTLTAAFWVFVSSAAAFNLSKYVAVWPAGIVGVWFLIAEPMLLTIMPPSVVLFLPAGMLLAFGFSKDAMISPPVYSEPSAL